MKFKKNKYSDIRDELINTLQDQLGGWLRRLQLRYEDAVFDFLDTNLEVKSGVINNSVKTHTGIRKIDLLERDFYKGQINPFLKRVSRGLVKILVANINYFDEFEKGFNERERLRKAEIRLLRELGIRKRDKKYSILKGGWIQDVGDISDAYRQIKYMAIRAARSGQTLVQFRKELKKYLRSNGASLGVIEKHFNTHLYDAYSQFDAIASDEFRKELGYEAARYQGGIIKTSRDFCIERNNEIYHEIEIEEWKKLEFDGKPENYDPIRDRGGYNCRHFFDWIPEQYALILRPDIKKYFDQSRKQKTNKKRLQK